MLQDSFGRSAAGKVVMALNQGSQGFDVLSLNHGFQIDHAPVAQGSESVLFVQDKGNAAAHACSKISSRLA